jgi:hypothetical protein
MTLPAPSLDGAVRLSAAIASVGIAYDAIEFYVGRREILDRFFDWRVIRSRYYILIDRPVLSFIFDLFFAGPQFLALVIAHGVAALMFPIVVVYSRPAAAALAGFVLVVHSLSNVRLLIGRDGADQMQTVLWTGLFFYCLPLTETARTISVAFIGAQLILSYLISGTAKAISPEWRSGSAIHLITRMATYCPPGLSRVLRRPVVSFSLCWLTILFELGSPLLLFAGRPGAYAMAAFGVAFHVGIAIAMGLTTFVFAFVAGFPILCHFAGRFF